MQNKKLKIIHFADTHLGFDFPLHPKIEIRRRGPDFFNNLQKILSYAEKSRPDLLVHGGDLFFRSRVAPSIVDRVYKMFFDFVNKTGIPLYIVPGNHERSCLPQSIYLAHPLIHIFSQARYFCFEKEGLRVSLHGFPFYRGAIRDQFKDLLEQSGWRSALSDIQLLVIHQSVDGAQVGPSGYTFRNSKDVIDIRDIPADAAAVLCGHIHRRQVLYSGRTPVIYPGSIERTSFAEKDETKGYYEIDFAGDAAESKKGVIEKIKFIELAARPMVDIYLDRMYSKIELKQWLNQQCSALAKDSIIRLRMTAKDNAHIPRISLPFIRSILPASFTLQTGLEFRQHENFKNQ
jgi:DNA repair protein SbcD/Mre11